MPPLPLIGLDGSHDLSLLLGLVLKTPPWTHPLASLSQLEAQDLGTRRRPGSDLKRRGRRWGLEDQYLSLSVVLRLVKNHIEIAQNCSRLASDSKIGVNGAIYDQYNPTEEGGGVLSSNFVHQMCHQGGRVGVLSSNFVHQMTPPPPLPPPPLVAHLVDKVGTKDPLSPPGGTSGGQSWN